VKQALSAGYRHLDCAWHYKNAKYTAKGIFDAGLSRDDVFISVKLGDFHGEPEEFDAAEQLQAVLDDVSLGHTDDSKRDTPG
jgi:diketogulonate reductase-like aldo/keto reductase